MKKEIIKEIVLKLTRGKIKTIRQIIGKGDVNKVFIIKLENKEILLRINLKDNGLVEFKKEAWCIKKAKEQGILGPNILKVGKYKNFSYMAYDYIEGKSGKDIKNKKEAWITIGNYAKKINSIKVKGYGLKFSPKENKFIESCDKYINYNIENLGQADKLLKLKIYSEKQLIKIKKYFLDLKKKKINIGLVHNDLSLRNVVVDKNEKVYLIDWGCAQADLVPYGEFVEILGAGYMDLKIPTVKEIDYFLKGYGISKKQFQILKKDISKFLLLVSFDKLRWALDKSPKDIKKMTKIAKKRLSYALKINDQYNPRASSKK